MKYTLVSIIVLLLGCQSVVERKPFHLSIDKPEDILGGHFSDLQHLFDKKNDTIYVINFWATWCKPCVKELPYFEEAYDHYTDQPVEIVLVSLDFPKELEKKLFPFVEDHQLKSRVVHLQDPDANNWIDKIEKTWSGAIPATLVYRNDQRAFYEQSFDNFAELEEIIQPFL